MNHLEAQSNIMPFINGQIPPDKQEEFVMHMNSCSKCHEELEVYYILLEGQKDAIISRFRLLVFSWLLFACLLLLYMQL